MSCIHKFYSNLHLKNLDFEPKILIIGTFNPSWSEENYAEWFYGRTSNNYFWDILPAMYGEPGLREAEFTKWKMFCRSKGIALTDLLEEILDADENNETHRAIITSYRDEDIVKYFKGHKLNNIVSILERYPSIQAVYFTTTTNNVFWNSAWAVISEYCGRKSLKCLKLITPSKNVRFQMKKGLGMSMPEFIYSDWKGKWELQSK